MDRLITILFCIAVGACTSVSPTVDKTAVTACSGYAVALDTLASLKQAGKLSTDTMTKVDQAISVAHPVCSLPNPPALDASTVIAVETAVSTLVTLAKGN